MHCGRERVWLIVGISSFILVRGGSTRWSVPKPQNYTVGYFDRFPPEYIITIKKIDFIIPASQTYVLFPIMNILIILCIKNEFIPIILTLLYSETSSIKRSSWWHP